jgi:hypothetical protein
MRRKPFVLLAALAALLALALPARAAETQIVVYNKGKTLRYDPDVSAELKEVCLETYDCKTGKLVKKETIEAYFHLSEDKEVITPDAICDECRKKFIIEKKGEKYFFGGIRDKEASKAEADAAAPPPVAGEGQKSLDGKVRRLAQDLIKVDPESKNPQTGKSNAANIRTKMITDMFKTQALTDQDLDPVANAILEDPSLDKNNKYLVLRSFGYAFLKSKDYPKAVFFCDKCTKLIPDNYTGYYEKAVAHREAGQIDESIRAFVKALAARPKEKVARDLANLLSSTPTTAKLGADKIATVKTKVDAVVSALMAKDEDKATDEALALDQLVDDLYAGKPADAGKKPPADDGGPSKPPPDSGGATPPPG